MLYYYVYFLEIGWFNPYGRIGFRYDGYTRNVVSHVTFTPFSKKGP